MSVDGVGPFHSKVPMQLGEDLYTYGNVVIPRLLHQTHQTLKFYTFGHNNTRVGDLLESYNHKS